jgi:hypothetical protein
VKTAARWQADSRSSHTQTGVRTISTKPNLITRKAAGKALQLCQMGCAQIEKRTRAIDGTTAIFFVSRSGATELEIPAIYQPLFTGPAA